MTRQQSVFSDEQSKTKTVALLVLGSEHYLGIGLVLLRNYTTGS